MQETLELVIVYLRGIWRYRWIAMAMAWLLFIVGWAIVYQKPVVYTANAKVYVDTQTVLEPLLKGLALEKDTGAYISLMARQLVTRPNLEQVAQAVGLDKEAKSTQELESIYARLERKVEVDGSRATARSRQSDFFVISYPDTDPARAKQIVQALITNFAEKTVEKSLLDSEAAKRFLEQQISEQREKLVAAEALIADFKRNNQDALPEQGVSYFQRLNGAQAAVDEVDLQIVEAEYRRDTLLRQLDEVSPTISSTPPDTRSVVTSTGSRVAALQERLDELLLKYTEAHPDVIATRRSIEEISKRGEMTRTEAVSGTLVPNPVYQELQVALGQARSEISALQARRQEFLRRLGRLRERRETLTKVETELQALTQDYDIAKQKFDALVARQGPANMAGNVEQAGEDVRFTVIDPPRVQETWPMVARSRVVLTTMVLAAGVGGGVGIAFLLSQIWPAIYGRRALSELTGFPVIGVVSQAMTTRVCWKKRLDVGAFVLFGCALVALHGTALFMELARHSQVLQGIGGIG